MGSSLYSSGRFEEAVASYDKALEINPHYGEIWSNRGLTLVRLGKYEEALNCFDKALEIQPDNDLILKNRYLTKKLMKGNIFGRIISASCSVIRSLLSTHG